MAVPSIELASKHPDFFPLRIVLVSVAAVTKDPGYLVRLAKLKPEGTATVRACRPSMTLISRHNSALKPGSSATSSAVVVGPVPEISKAPV